MARTFTLLLALWTFALSLPLCAIGAIRHSCEQDQKADCSHEAGCAQDPCALKVVPSDSLHQLSQHYLVIASCVPLISIAVPSSFTAVVAMYAFTVSLPWHGQRYPQGSFPLLI